MNGRVAHGLRWVVLAATLTCGVRVHADDAIAGWIARLADERTRDQARDKLREAGRRAIPQLIGALAHPDATVRGEVAFVLGRMRGVKAVSALVKTLGDKDAGVRGKVAYALGEIADKRAVPGLVAVLADPDAGVRANGCFALGQIGSPEPARELVKGLTDPDQTVRNFAANALGLCRQPKVLPALAWTALNDVSPGVRALAAAAMGTLKDAQACGVLIGLLEDKAYLVRARAIEALIVLTGKRRGYDARPRRPRAAAIAAWKNWHRRSARGHAVLTPRRPIEVYETWDGAPKPEPGPAAATGLDDGLGRPAPASPIFATKRRDADGENTKLKDEHVALFEAASKTFDAGDLAEAARGFERCVAAVPAWQVAWVNLAIARHRLKHYDKAVAAYLRCVQLDPRDTEGYNGLGAACEMRDRPDDAETYYRLALSQAPTHRAARCNLAELLYRRGRHAAARPVYETLLKTGPVEGVDAGCVKVRLAGCHLSAGDAARAVRMLEEACAGAPRSQVWVEAARTFYRMKRFARAKTLLDGAFRSADARAESAYLLSLFLVRVPDATLRDARQAAFYAELAMTAAPQDPRYLAAGAEVAYARGDKRNAEGFIRKAHTLDPASSAIRAQFEKYTREAKDVPDP